MNRIILICSTIITLGLISFSCKRDVNYPSIGQNFAEPLDIEVSDDGSHFYVLNADMDSSFESGSLMVLDLEGNITNTVEVPRLGRMLRVVGDELFAIFDFSGRENEVKASVKVFDIATPAEPDLKNSWEVDCSPIGVQAAEDYDYFAISCQGGEIVIGDRETNSVHKVRNFQYPRRAMHLDTQRNLLYAFVTDFGRPNALVSNEIFADQFTYDENFNPTEASNDVPDIFEKSQKSVRRTESYRNAFRFLVYDIAAGKEAGFPMEESSEELEEKELRWMYFSFETDVDKPNEELEIPTKFYRSNFWKALPVEGDSNSFYLSNRGVISGGRSADTNQIIKVTVAGDPVAFNGDAPPATSSYFQFEQVYKEHINQGHEPKAKQNYLSDFELTTIDGREVAIVNNFKDLSNFNDPEDGGAWFSISAATIDNTEDTAWGHVKESSSGSDGFYQFALGSNGVVASVSFYDNSVIFLEVNADTDIKEVKRIKN